MYVIIVKNIIAMIALAHLTYTLNAIQTFAINVLTNTEENL